MGFGRENRIVIELILKKSKCTSLQDRMKSKSAIKYSINKELKQNADKPWILPV
jgi:viroplasmin and RNaseH domain-containing protein